MHTSATPIAAETSEEKPAQRVAIQGYAGAFHEIAARRYCAPGNPHIVPADTFSDLVKMVEAGEQCDIGLMAIENTLAGSLIGNYKLLTKSRLRVIGEVFLRIRQNLMVLPGQSIADLREVHSHPIAISQCIEFFQQYPHIKLIDTLDTALSARIVREKQLKDVGAIASTLAAELYELDVIAPSIETNKKNFTRFLVLQHKDRAPVIEEANKISLSFSIDHTVGSLHKMLAALAAYGCNLTKIQSVPIVGRDWEYEFFLDFTTETPEVFAPALKAVKPLTHDLKVLGAYRMGVHYDK
jgi:prephenate dehydratase